MNNLIELSEKELVDQMKATQYEKFKTLVRMHISFELELNTDEFDLPSHEIVYEDKGKIKKWNRLSKKHKYTGTSCGANAKSAVSSPTDGCVQQINADFLLHLTEMKEFLMLEKNLKQEGIFRKTGSVSRQNELRSRIKNKEPLNLLSAGYSAHDLATVFKSYLAEMSEPLLTDAHYPAHLQIAPLCTGMSFNISSTNISMRPERIKREQRLLNSMQFLLLLLPDDNRSVLINVIDILHAVMKFECINKMSAENLATLFAPHLICPRHLPPEALHFLSKKLSSVIAYMITKGALIFEIPAKLTTDIKAYFHERKRQKTMSPEHTLDDSISDISTVNTVYTFVDRERTAAAHTANNTDTELAQLYAHIQSLPESSKKRRLIKQFNKQNGQGTPLQLVIMNRLKNSEATRSAKSLGESIKKHVFHKGIISRTPKRSNADIKPMISNHAETPHFSNSKQPKLRVLFQSPISTKSLEIIETNTHMHETPKLKKSASSSSLLLNSSSSSPSSVRTPPHSHIYQHASSKKLTDDIEASTSSSLSPTHSNDGFPQNLQLKSNPFTNITCSAHNLSSTSKETIQNDTATKLCTKHIFNNIANLNNRAASNGGEKKTVAWNVDQNNIENDNEENNSPERFLTDFELQKSRYKSEPNLSKAATLPTNVAAFGKLQLTRKLIKGVSMGNLKIPLVRSFSSNTKRRHSEENQTMTKAPTLGSALSNVFTQDEHLIEEDSIDGDFKATDKMSESGCMSSADTFESSPCEFSTDGGNHVEMLVQPTGLYRNIDLLTSTPALLLGRRSMSPITKSAQRMPRSMQESIMTPRSRKPVMVLTATTLAPTEVTNEESYTNEMSNSIFNGRMFEDNTAGTVDKVNDVECSKKPNSSNKTETYEALSDNFKRYLRSRSVFTDSPIADLSFSSQSDDFKDEDDESTKNNSTTHHICNLSDSQLSPSLLYCLDGNQPLPQIETSENILCSFESCGTPYANKNENLLERYNSSQTRFDKAIKRGATPPEDCNANENTTNNDHEVTKKMLITDLTNETSF